MISPLWGILLFVLKESWSPNSCSFFHCRSYIYVWWNKFPSCFVPRTTVYFVYIFSYHYARFWTNLADDYEVWGFTDFVWLTFLFVPQLHCELLRSLSVNLINRSFNARSVFIFCQVTDWVFCINFLIIPRKFCHVWL